MEINLLKVKRLDQEKIYYFESKHDLYYACDMLDYLDEQYEYKTYSIGMLSSLAIKDFKKKPLGDKLKEILSGNPSQ